ncbi:hypothetical protein [Chitinophaga sp. Cy-1792]|uniref:hypothetical protein n=1 Tax=Chitinophaga sp. Cy-1792 TaxID=2608339 RepID=UPI00141E79A1|nr:hypothetical protein [Chitinophaga sp. Cy-1792]NIG53368.1 hypothetical protein [Chitinophaga sp. Cy-1792]
MDTRANKLNELIRSRPAMFIGNLRFTGFANMLEYVLEEMLTETRNETTITIEFLHSGNIRLSATKVATAGLISCIHHLDLPEMQQPSALPIAIMIALSAHAEIEIHHEEDIYTIDSKQGFYILNISNGKGTPGDVMIEFALDTAIFRQFDVDYEQTTLLLQKFAYLYPGIRIVTTDERTDFKRNVLLYPQGIGRMLDGAIGQHPHANPFFRMDLKANIRDYVYQISFCYQPLWITTSYVRSFANHYELFLGGSLIDGVQEGMIMAIKEAAVKAKTKIRISKRKLVESMILIAAVRGKGFELTGPARWRLESAVIRNDIKKFVFAEVARYLAVNPDDRNRVIGNFAYEFE